MDTKKTLSSYASSSDIKKSIKQQRPIDKPNNSINPYSFYHDRKTTNSLLSASDSIQIDDLSLNRSIS